MPRALVRSSFNVFEFLGTGSGRSSEWECQSIDFDDSTQPGTAIERENQKSKKKSSHFFLKKKFIKKKSCRKIKLI